MQAFSGAMPENFRYRQAFLSGRPRHAPFDAFSLRHPAMEHGRRAKIFAPFDALRGFSDAVTAQETLYEPFRVLDGEQAACLSRKLEALLPLVRDSRLARENQVRVRVTYFRPCGEPEMAGGEGFGRYTALEGTLRRLDPIRRQMLVDDLVIDLEDVYDIQDPEGKAFGDMEYSDETEEDPENG